MSGQFADWLRTRAGSTRVLYSFNLLYLKIRLVSHNVVDAIVHVDALFHCDKLELLSYFMFENNGESHFAKSIRSCSI